MNVERLSRIQWHRRLRGYLSNVGFRLRFGPGNRWETEKDFEWSNNTTPVPHQYPTVSLSTWIFLQFMRCHGEGSEA